jgi:hypothetical protein
MNVGADMKPQGHTVLLQHLLEHGDPVADCPAVFS